MEISADLARDHQPLAKGAHSRIDAADPELRRGLDLGPAAIGDDGLTIVDCLLQVGGSAATENRNVGQNRGCRARRVGIELVIRVAAARRIDDVLK